MSSEVPMNRIRVMSSIGGFHVQLGDLVLWVTSKGHWEDIAEAVTECFQAVGAPRQIPLPRTDSVKPTDYTTVNCSGACYQGEDE
jgi:hypothetical protein